MTKFESHKQNSGKSLCRCSVFPRPFTHGGGGVGQSVNGRDLRGGDIDLMGDLTSIDYIIN